MKRIIEHMLLFLMCLYTATLSAAETPLMPGTDSRWIAESIKLHGVPSAMLAVSHPADIQRVISWYREHWSAIGHVQLSEQDGAQVIAVGSDEDGIAAFRSLQLESCQRGTCGLLIVSEFDESTEEKLSVDTDKAEDPVQPFTASENGRYLPLPTGVDVLSVEHHQDAGKLATTWTLNSERSVEATASQLLMQWQSDHWTVLTDRRMQNSVDGCHLELRRSGSRLSAWIAQDRRWANRTLVFVIEQQAEEREP